MVSSKAIIRNEMGLHLRPAGTLCKAALQYQCSVQITNGERSGNAKSMISVLSTLVRGGDEITISCDGPDEEEALKGLLSLIESGLGDDLPESGDPAGKE